MLKITGWATFLLFIVLMYSQCYPKKDYKAKHGFAASDDFQRLSREEQVEKCGSCHQEIYKNEMMGPHANAAKNLIGHINFVNSQKYDCKLYKNIINKDKEACYGCHSSENLYEGAFVRNDDDFYFNAAKRIESRDGNKTITGVDCMTCHFDGKRVITVGNYEPSVNRGNCPDYCSPVSSKFFSSNANCAPCHNEQYDNVKSFNSDNHVDLTCSSCHEQRDSFQKYTHYTYWAHNPINILLPKNLNLFNCIETAYIPEKGAVKITWRNKDDVHKVSVCTELVALIEIKDQAKIVVLDTVRLNRRKTYLDLAHVKAGDFPGTDGYEFRGLNDSLIKFIPLNVVGKRANYTLSITGIKKEQFWLNDSINTLYYKKDFKL